MSIVLSSFNGERRDPVSHCLHPGNGLRAYNPALMRFSCPDSWSPFDAGGMNPSAWCDGDPINRSDPSGHFSWQAAAGIGLGIFGIVSSLFTAGASLAAAASLSAALAASSELSLLTGSSTLLADISAVASSVTVDNHPGISAILGWLSFASGILSVAGGVMRGGYRLLTPSQDGKLAGNSFTLGNRSGSQLNPNFVIATMSPERIEIEDRSFLRYVSREGNNKAIFVSHSRFLPARYLNGSARVTLPEGMSVSYYVRRGETLSAWNMLRIYQHLQESTGAEIPLFSQTYRGNAQIENLNLMPISEDAVSLAMMHSPPDYSYDVIVPVRRAETRHLIALAQRYHYHDLQILGCRGRRFFT